MKASPAVSLLLTNLQLLDYNNSNDAFPISIETFTSLKNKGKAFEHIIHHLFHTYQPEEATARFQACWPVYEPVQARELRNVVFKWLTDLKRSGQLQIGGNVIIRRSLFDDCSGERYEELLLAVSTMVLRIQIDRGFFRDNFKTTIAYKQCSTHNPSLSLLTPLILAYQSSLTRLLASRNSSKAQWKSFSSFLEQKEISLKALQAELARGPRFEISQEKEDSIVSRWRNNWLGDEKWLDTLVNGDTELGRQRILEMAFDRALAKHHLYNEGNTSGSTMTGISLLEKQLEEQSKKVNDLKALKENLQGVNISGANKPEIPKATGVETKASTKKKGLNVAFNRHNQIQAAQTVLKVQGSELGQVSDNPICGLLLEMRNEIASVDSSKRRRRPRPNLTVLRSFELQDPFGLSSEPPLSMRKSGLPQPARIARPSAISAIKPPVVIGSKVASDARFKKVENPTEQAMKESAILPHPEKPATAMPSDSTRCRNQLNSLEGDDSGSGNLSPVSESLSCLSSPIRLPSPGKHERPFSASSNVSENERFSDFGDDTPYRIAQTPPSSYRRAGSPTPKAQRSSKTNINELTPTQQTARQGKYPRSALGYVRGDESLVEHIVSKVTKSSYSPEKGSPVRKGVPVPRNRFGFRSPEVSPMREDRSFMFEHDKSSLSPFGTPLPQPLSSPPSMLPSLSPKRGRQLQPNIKLNFGVELERNVDETNTLNHGVRQVKGQNFAVTPMKFPSEDVTPKEELLISADYQSVFKSRPKLAFSPQFTPATPGSISDRLSPELKLNSGFTSDEDNSFQSR